jgi:hypothetical protein
VLDPSFLLSFSPLQEGFPQQLTWQEYLLSYILLLSITPENGRRGFE